MECLLEKHCLNAGEKCGICGRLYASHFIPAGDAIKCSNCLYYEEPINSYYCIDCRDRFRDQWKDQTMKEKARFDHIVNKDSFRMFAIPKREFDAVSEDAESSGGIPHIRIGDVYIVYMIKFEYSEEYKKDQLILITDKIMKDNNLDKGALHYVFATSQQQIHPMKVRTGYQLYKDACEEAGEDIETGVSEETLKREGFLMASTDEKYGASCIAYPSFFSRIFDVVKSGFYVIMSSVHELLIISDRYEIPKTDLLEMVKMNNCDRNVLDEEDVLSNQLIHFDEIGNMKVIDQFGVEEGMFAFNHTN